MASQHLINSLRNHANSLISTHGRTNKLPATIIAAQFKRVIKVDKSGKVPYPISSYLKKELEKIGPLGSKGFKNWIGCCCEVRSSNQILLVLESSSRKTAPLKSIIFTNAIRPRTNQVINRCGNCQAVFG